MNYLDLTAGNEEYAVPQECDLKWSFGAPLPTLVQWEFGTRLFFYLRGDRDEVGSISFLQCIAIRFGPPGEEGHYLDGKGWEPYTFLRVVESEWLRREIGADSGLTHYILPFHDTTFECLALSFRERRYEGSIGDAVNAMMDEDW
jgi:hypothetical protein